MSTPKDGSKDPTSSQSDLLSEIRNKGQSALKKVGPPRGSPEKFGEDKDAEAKKLGLSGLDLIQLNKLRREKNTEKDALDEQTYDDTKGKKEKDVLYVKIAKLKNELKIIDRLINKLVTEQEKVSKAAAAPASRVIASPLLAPTLSAEEQKIAKQKEELKKSREALSEAQRAVDELNKTIKSSSTITITEVRRKQMIFEGKKDPIEIAKKAKKEAEEKLSSAQTTLEARKQDVARREKLLTDAQQKHVPGKVLLDGSPPKVIDQEEKRIKDELEKVKREREALNSELKALVMRTANQHNYDEDEDIDEDDQKELEELKKLEDKIKTYSVQLKTKDDAIRKLEAQLIKYQQEPTVVAAPVAPAQPPAQPVSSAVASSKTVSLVETTAKHAINALRGRTRVEIPRGKPVEAKKAVAESPAMPQRTPSLPPLPPAPPLSKAALVKKAPGGNTPTTPRTPLPPIPQTPKPADKVAVEKKVVAPQSTKIGASTSTKAPATAILRATEAGGNINAPAQRVIPKLIEELKKNKYEGGFFKYYRNRQKLFLDLLSEKINNEKISPLVRIALADRLLTLLSNELQRETRMSELWSSRESGLAKTVGNVRKTLTAFKNNFPEYEQKSVPLDELKEELEKMQKDRRMPNSEKELLNEALKGPAKALNEDKVKRRPGA